MNQILIEIPGLGLRLHGFSLMFLTAVLGAVALTAWRARREGIDPNDVFDLAPWLCGGGLIGARVMFLMMHPEVVESPLDVFKIWKGGIVFYGCIIGGLIGSTIYWRRRRFPFLPMCDAVAPALVLGLTIGRLGCWFNGCCYGRVSSLPWAVRFPSRSLPWGRHVHDGLIAASSAYSLPIHPTQLYSVAEGLLLIALLTWAFPRRRRDGEVMGLLMVAYAFSRFLVEAFRGDEAGVFFGLTVSQGVSVGLLLAGVAFNGWLRSTPTRLYRDRRVVDGDHAIPAPASRSQRPTTAGTARVG